MNAPNNQELSFQKSFHYNAKQSTMILILFLLMSKKQLNKMELIMACFIRLLKLNGQLSKKHTSHKKTEITKVHHRSPKKYNKNSRI